MMIPFRLLVLATAAALLLASAARAQIGGDPDALAELAGLQVEPSAEASFRTEAGLVVDLVTRNGALSEVRGHAASWDAPQALEVAALVGAATGFGPGVEAPVLDFLERAVPEIAGAGPTAVGIDHFQLTLDVVGDAAPFAVSFALSLAEVPTEAFPETRHGKGPADAPIVMREFSDFQCPACRRFALDVKPQLESALLARGDVRIEFHHFPLIGSFPNSFRAAEASECVTDANPGDAEAFWSYARELFQHQPDWGRLADPDARFVQIAVEAGMNVDGVAACLADGAHEETVLEAYRAAVALQLRGTPSVFMGGIRLQNFVDPNAYQQAIGYLEAFGVHEGR
jgi:protein-disulfide isomerase